MSPASPVTEAKRPSRRSAWCRGGWTWQHALAVVVLVAGAVWATGGTWSDIWSIAMEDPENSHLFLVPFVAGWLLWVRRDRFRGCTQEATWIGPALIAVGWAANRFGDYALIQSLWHLGALLVVVGAFLTVAGARFLFRFLPAFVALAFVIPAPGRIRQAIAIPLQGATARATQLVLETLGADVERSGNMLSINHNDVMIADACNGMRMVFALVMVSFTFAYGLPLRNGFRVGIVLLSPFTAIVFNVIRLVPTVWAFGEFSPAVAEAIHDAGGWLMLPLAFFGLLGVIRLLRWAQVPVTPYALAYGS